MSGFTYDDGRPASDFYETPVCATQTLLAEIAIPGPVWEPACGKGAISDVLLASGKTVLSSDLFHHGYGVSGIDFLEVAPPTGARSIVTNPPYSIANEFAKKAISDVKKTDGVLALLLRLSWLESLKRQKQIFEPDPVHHVVVFSRRLPMMHRPEYTGKKSTSTVAYAWFVWDYTGKFIGMNSHLPQIMWADWRQQ